MNENTHRVLVGNVRHRLKRDGGLFPAGAAQLPRDLLQDLREDALDQPLWSALREVPSLWVGCSVAYRQEDRQADTGTNASTNCLSGESNWGCRRRLLGNFLQV